MQYDGFLVAEEPRLAATDFDAEMGSFSDPEVPGVSWGWAQKMGSFGILLFRRKSRVAVPRLAARGLSKVAFMGLLLGRYDAEVGRGGELNWVSKGGKEDGGWDGV